MARVVATAGCRFLDVVVVVLVVVVVELIVVLILVVQLLLDCAVFAACDCDSNVALLVLLHFLVSHPDTALERGEVEREDLVAEAHRGGCVWLGAGVQ